MNKFLILISFLILPIAAQAYIPPYWMILSRTSDHHGKGIYSIDQDIVFNHKEEPIVINERWTILSENSMRVEITSKRGLTEPLRAVYVYQNNQKHYIDENGLRKSEKISDDFFEPYFHYRLSKNLKPMLVAQNIAPAISLKSEPHRYSPKKPTPEPEPYVRLARQGGVVTYAIGSPTPVSAQDLYPGLWIEQDQFLIKKLRLASQLTIVAEQYSSYSGNLWLPKERQIQWSTATAKIYVNNVTPVAANPKTKAVLEASSLNFGQDPNLSRLLPADETLRQFFTRMR